MYALTDAASKGKIHHFSHGCKISVDVIVVS